LTFDEVDVPEGGSKMKGSRMNVRLFALLAVLCCLAGLGSSVVQAQSVLNYPPFPNSGTAGLQTNGNAQVQPNGSFLRLTDANFGEVGSAWFGITGGTTSAPLALAGGFTTTFQLQFTNPGGVEAADGMVFVVQNGSFINNCNTASPPVCSSGSSALGPSDGLGGELGYTGLTNSVAVEFDTYANGNYGDTVATFAHSSADEVSVQSCGPNANTSDHTATNGPGNVTCTFGRVDLSTLGTPIYLLDQLPHKATIKYLAPPTPGGNCPPGSTPNSGACGSLTIMVDTQTVLTVPFSLSYLGLDSNGDAFPGFTAATGAGFEDQDILSWNFMQTIVGTPAVPGTTQTFSFNPNEGTLDVETAIFPNSPNLQNTGVIPIISSYSVPPSAPNSLWANSPLATATCISLSAAAGNCAPKREVCQTPMSMQAPTGANCPFDPGVEDVLLADNYDPVTTITDLNIVGDPGVVSLNDSQTCPFSAPFASLPCPSNGSKSFTGPGQSKTVHGSSNSFYYYVTGILPPHTTPTGVVNVNGVNWVDGNNAVQMTLTATPPTTPSPNPTGFYPSPIDYVAYLNLPASSAPPDPTLPPFTFPPNPPEGTVVFSSNAETASQTVISNGVSGNGSTCPAVLDPTTGSARILPADPAYSFPVLANLGTLAEGAYNLYYETEDCTRTAERQYTFQPGSTWVTQYKSLAFTADDTPPSINITVPSAGAIYPANASVSPSFTCTDGGPHGGSGVKTCAGSSSPLDTKPTGGILTSKTFTVTSGDNVGNMAAPKKVSYSVSCMYATNTINPATLVRGQNFTFTGSVTNCTGSLQAITISVVLSGPLGASCKNQSLTLVNQLTLPIPPLSKALSFTLGPFSIPKTGCTGGYTLTTTTSNKGTTDFVYTEMLNISN
jgi:Bacterial lectin